MHKLIKSNIVSNYVGLILIYTTTLEHFLNKIIKCVGVGNIRVRIDITYIFGCTLYGNNTCT